MGNERSGRYVQQLSGDLAYKAFIPNPLPPNPAVHFDAELINLLAQANQAIGRLDGILRLSNIANSELFLYMYIRKEAVLSSQIEGTQASLEDILEKEEEILQNEQNDDLKVTLNYIKAMNYGLKRLQELPFSIRLIKEIHGVLLEGIRGNDKHPGELRASQNWIGRPGSSLNDAAYVPPPVPEMQEALYALEKYVHAEKTYPALIECGLIHAQFETIHPFLDGNGRVGRLLITFLLCMEGALSHPLLYLSYYFKKNRKEYYTNLGEIRISGNWEGWLKFFLRGVIETANNVVELSEKILSLKDRHMEALQKATRKSYAKDLLEKLFTHPIFTVGKAQQLCDSSYNTAKSIIKTFKELNIVVEKGNNKRNRKYYYQEYLNLLNEETELK